MIEEEIEEPGVNLPKVAKIGTLASAPGICVPDSKVRNVSFKVSYGGFMLVILALGSLRQEGSIVLVWTTQHISGQLGIHNEMLSQKNQTSQAQKDS